MSQSVSVRIKKDNAMKALRRRLPDEIANGIGQAAEASGQEMVMLARSLAPVRKGTRGGSLRASIALTKGGERTPAFSQPGGSSVVPDGAVMVTAGNARVRYPHFVEYGAREHELYKGAGSKLERGRWRFMRHRERHPGMKAQPYFWPAYRLIRKKFASRVTRALNKAVKAVASAEK